MISVFNNLLDGWHTLLSSLSLDGTSIPVYRTDAPSDAPSMYVILRAESSSDRSNNSEFVTNPVIVTEVVAKFAASELIRDNITGRIDNQIAGLVSPTPSTHGVSASGCQVVSIKRQDETILTDDDGTYRTHRLIVRNRHRILQR